MGKNLEYLKNKYISLNDNYENLEKLLKEYNPWTDKNIGKLLEDFFAALENEDNEFSWLKIDSYDKKKDKEKKDLHEELKHKKGKAVSIDYGIPSHVRGDIENGTLFLCLVNPNIDVKVAMCEACQMKNKENIKKYIFDSRSEGGILYKELDENGIENPGYYTSNYFNAILSLANNKKLKKVGDSLSDMSKNIVNLEAFPFRSSTPNFAIDEDNAKDRFANCLVNSISNVSMLSARIIIWKILEYINKDKEKEEDSDKDKVKVRPVFIFRRFNRAWRPSIENVLKKDFIEKNKKDFIEINKDDLEEEEKAINIVVDNIINELHDEFFYTIGPKDHDNMLKMGKNIYKNDVNMYVKNEKEDKEIDRQNKKEVFKTLITDALISQKDNNGN